MYVVACAYNIDMAGIFVLLICDWSPVFLGLPADPLEAPRGPPGVRGPQVETPWYKWRELIKWIVRWWWRIWLAWSQFLSKSSDKSATTATRILQPNSCLRMEQFTIFCRRGFVCQHFQEEAGWLESGCGFLKHQLLVHHIYKLQVTSLIFYVCLCIYMSIVEYYYIHLYSP